MYFRKSLVAFQEYLNKPNKIVLMPLQEGEDKIL